MRYDQLFTKTLLTAILTSMVMSVSASNKRDSLNILNRIYNYQQANTAAIDSLEDQVYAKFRYHVDKRNAILWLIPSMYVMAKDERDYIRESYSKVLFTNAHDYDITNQLLSGTIRHNRKALPTLLDYMTPNIYDIDLYNGHMLSPFNKCNRRYYRFTQKLQHDGTTRLEFRPKIYNTQLLNGYAIVDTNTGRIIRTLLNGEYDMLTFRTEITQGEEGGRSIMPAKCTTAATFRFMGNRISALFDASYNCNKTLPDSVERMDSRELMDEVRPTPLTETDKHIYEAYDQKNRQDSMEQDTLPKKQRLWKKIFWDTIGENLVTPIKAESEEANFSMSPIINPMYVSYSHARGVRYKMRFRSQYNFSAHRYLTLNPTFGYTFKEHQFYFTAPLRMTYNPKRNGYTEVIFGNGNRISTSTVMDVINAAHQDTINFDNTDMDKFKDQHFSIINNIMVFDWLDIETGFIYHRRSAVNKELMKCYDMPTEYRSFAPSIGLKFSPWLNRGPVLSVDYERGVKGVNKSDLEYERWEFDAQWKKKIPGLRLLNMRAGAGFYTNKKDNLFVDFANFRDENLPEGWDDDWSGNFQLLRSRVYNQSDYYLRGNVSYESPMLVATWIPYLGKYIEKERFYLSGVLLQDSRPYYELGYGFTNRYISVGAFASFRNTHFDRIGVEVEFELFRRW